MAHRRAVQGVLEVLDLRLEVGDAPLEALTRSVLAPAPENAMVLVPTADALPSSSVPVPICVVPL